MVTRVVQWVESIASNKRIGNCIVEIMRRETNSDANICARTHERRDQRSKRKVTLILVEDLVARQPLGIGLQFLSTSWCLKCARYLRHAFSSVRAANFLQQSVCARSRLRGAAQRAHAWSLDRVGHRHEREAWFPWVQNTCEYLLWPGWLVIIIS